MHHPTYDDHGHGHMMNGGGGGVVVLVGVCALLVVALVVVALLVIERGRRDSGRGTGVPGPDPAARAALDGRLARGEVTHEEYDAVRALLERA